jgi:hypothetical protein
LCPAISLHGGELKRSQIPQGDKTLHFDTIWIGKASMAVDVDFLVTDSLCNSGAFSNPNAVRDCPFILKGAWFLSQSWKFFSYAALLFLKLFSAAQQLLLS